MNTFDYRFFQKLSKMDALVKLNEYDSTLIPPQDGLQHFERYYRHMIELYGTITIEIIQTSNPSMTEWERLMEYNDHHKEYPPLNRSIPSRKPPLS